MRMGMAWVGCLLAAGQAAAGAEGFVPPSEAARLRAVGDLAGLSPALRAAFRPGEAFTAIDRPGPRDWLAQHPEKGQAYDAYVRSRPNRPDRRRRLLYLQPIGSFDERLAPDLADLASYAEAFFGLPARVQAPLALRPGRITERKNPMSGNRQLLTHDLLKHLRGGLPRDAYCRIGLTLTDLYPDPSWNFVFGQASLRERVGVYSFARYRPSFYGRAARAGDNELVLKRSLKVLTHETGHMFGMAHCVYYNCLMNGSNHLGESDSRPAVLCPVCLRKLHYAVGFDPAARYRALRTWCREHGLEEQADWYADRLVDLSQAQASPP